MKRLLVAIFFCMVPLFVSTNAQVIRTAKTTTASNLRLLFDFDGIMGSRFVNWPNSPSCEHPSGSRIEHLYWGGLWVGAKRRTDGTINVSTATSDQALTPFPRSGQEFVSQASDTIIERSSIPGSPHWDPNAISHQDFLIGYVDTCRIAENGDTIFSHQPLGLSIRQESYCWNYSNTEGIVLLSFTINNISGTVIDSVCVGYWANFVVRNTNSIPPGTPGFFSHSASGYIDSIRLAYVFDFDGIPVLPPANSYVGIKVLGTIPVLQGLSAHAYFNAWGYRRTSGDVAFFSPSDDAANVNGARSRYDRLASSLPPDKIALLRVTPDNMTTLVSVGPFSSLQPGDSLKVTFGLACARKVGTAPASNDTPEQRQLLVSELNNAQSIYDNGLVVGVSDRPTIRPGNYILGCNYPNPFNPSTIIQFSIPRSDFVTLQVFNMLGVQIKSLVSENLPPGTHEVEWNALGLPSGAYFYRLQVGGFSDTKKLILLK